VADIQLARSGYGGASCDDIHKTMNELIARGVKFVGKIEERGYGLVTHFRMPGNAVVELYQPRYLKSVRSRKTKP
jgi:hypothetical protein